MATYSPLHNRPIQRRPHTEKLKSKTTVWERAKYYAPALALWGFLSASLGLLVTLFIIAANNQVAKNAKILFPLYIDPGPSGQNWIRLADAVRNHPGVEFLVVLNPNNGPNTSATPDPKYLAGFELLYASNPKNIQLLGYVHQSYGERSVDDVARDIRTWATWGNKNMYNNKLSGIFFDEGPHSDNQTGIQYIQEVNIVARSTPGFVNTAFTVQNPGTLPSKQYFGGQRKTDTTVILEDTFEAYNSMERTYDGLEKRYGVMTSKFSMILYAVPKMNQTGWNQAVAEVLSDVQYLFLTDATVDQYSKFGDQWEMFVAAVANVDKPADEQDVASEDAPAGKTD